MLGRIFIFVILFSSLGVFIKLKRYGAPLSSILYSIGVPGAVLLASLIYGYKMINNEKKIKKISRLKKIKLYVSFTFKCIKSLPLLTGLMCVEFGKRKIGIIELLEQGIVSITKKNIKRIFNIFSTKVENYNIETYNAKYMLRNI